MQQAIPPIVVDDRGDVVLYSSVEAACSQIEEIDVVDAVYEVFDSRGYPLTLSVDEGLVVLRLDPGSVPEPEELLRRLRRFISRVGVERIGVANVESVSLDVAVRALARFFELA